MKTARISKQKLDGIYRQMNGNDFDVSKMEGPYDKAFEAGFLGFAGGLDHIEKSRWALKIIDRGISGASGGFRDNTIKFMVPVKWRS